MSGPTKKWRASIPRDLPVKGKVSAVVSFKSHKGSRIEFVGIVDEEKMLEAWKIIIAAKGGNKP